MTYYESAARYWIDWVRRHNSQEELAKIDIAACEKSLGNGILEIVNEEGAVTMTLIYSHEHLVWQNVKGVPFKDYGSFKPNETVMWITPYEVVFAENKHGPIQTVYSEKSNR